MNDCITCGPYQHVPKPLLRTWWFLHRRTDRHLARSKYYRPSARREEMDED